MGAPPTMGTAVPGNFLTAAYWNANVAALGNFILNPPRFKAYASSPPTNVASGITPITVPLDVEIYDSDNGHSTTSNSSRYVVQVAGLYTVTAQAAWASNATGSRSVNIYLNGNYARGGVLQGPATSANSWAGSITADVQLAVGDYVECAVWQSSGAALSMASSTGFGPSLTLRWVSF